MRTALHLTALVLALVAAPASQAQTAFMPYLGYNFGDGDTNDGQLVVGVGGRLGTFVSYPISLALQPQVEVGLDDDSAIQLDVNAVAGFGSGALAPYAGAGLAVVFRDPAGDDDSETDLGLNLLGGVTFNPTAFVQPFVQARYSIFDEDVENALSVQGGVMLGL